MRTYHSTTLQQPWQSVHSLSAFGYYCNACTSHWLNQLVLHKRLLNSCCTEPTQLLWPTAFRVAGPSVWNSLPDSLRNPITGGNSFRQSLKTFLFATCWCIQRIRGFTTMRYINRFFTHLLTSLWRVGLSVRKCCLCCALITNWTSSCDSWHTVTTLSATEWPSNDELTQVYLYLLHCQET